MPSREKSVVTSASCPGGIRRTAQSSPIPIATPARLTAARRMLEISAFSWTGTTEPLYRLHLIGGNSSLLAGARLIIHAFLLFLGQFYGASVRWIRLFSRRTPAFGRRSSKQVAEQQTGNTSRRAFPTTLLGNRNVWSGSVDRGNRLCYRLTAVSINLWLT